MALLDDLFDDFVKEPDAGNPPQDNPGNDNAEQPADRAREDSDEKEPAKDSPLFPTGRDWEDFKAGKMRA